MIGTREVSYIDMERVLATAHASGCYLEINAEPDRLDLIDIHAHAAKALGVKLAISTDAHSVDALGLPRLADSR